MMRDEKRSEEQTEGGSYRKIDLDAIPELPTNCRLPDQSYFGHLLHIRSPPSPSSLSSALGNEDCKGEEGGDRKATINLTA